MIRTEVTTAGLHALETCDPAVDEVEQEMLGDLAADEAAQLREALLRCGRALELGLEAAPGATTP